MKLYVSKETIKEAIDYFYTIKSKNDYFSTFIIMNKMGATTDKAVDLSKKENKERFLSNLSKLGGLFDYQESPKKYSVMFPDKISNDGKSRYFNPATAFKGLMSRFKDAIRNQSPRLFIPLEENGSNEYRLANNYRDLLKESVVPQEKISFFNFSIWLYRFTPINFPDNTDISLNEFKRTLEKGVKAYLSLREKDFDLLFDNDFFKNDIEYSTDCISGEEFRNLLTDDKQIIKTTFSTEDSIGSSLDTFEITEEKSKRYMLMNEKNLASYDINDILKLKKQLVLTGVPGVGKSWFCQQQEEKFFKTFKIQFHPNYTYEEFIGGETLNNGNLEFKKGIFLKAILEAKNEPEEDFLFIIDEINRGNISEIFGELLLLLDRSSNYRVQLSKNIEDFSDVNLPDNLYILATMNNSDRSIAILDLAIRRRFAFVELTPNYELLSNQFSYQNFDLGKILKTINKKIIQSTGDRQKILGQSYLIPPNGSNNWNDKDFYLNFISIILPTIQEYAANDDSIMTSILGEELSKIILEKEDFEEKFTDKFGNAKKE